MIRSGIVQPCTQNTAVGYEVAGTPKKMTSYRTWLFSGGWPRFDGWPAKNVHTDLAFAQQSGLPTRAASGAMMQGYLSELMIDLFGARWLERGLLSLKFIRIVDVGDTITARASVSTRHPEVGTTRFELQVWCENQRGERVVVGTGTGWVSDECPLPNPPPC